MKAMQSPSIWYKTTAIASIYGSILLGSNIYWATTEQIKPKQAHSIEISSNLGTILIKSLTTNRQFNDKCYVLCYLDLVSAVGHPIQPAHKAMDALFGGA